MSDLIDLPEDVRAEISGYVEQDAADLSTMIETIGVTIAAKRDEAKAARTSSGIEQIWLEAEEAYIGMDDANRGEFGNARWSKPMSKEGPVTKERVSRGSEHRSTIYHRLTSRYVDAGVAKLCEILLPADDRAFSFSEMEVPDLIKASKDERQVVHSDLGEPLTKAPPPPLPAQMQAGAAAAPDADPMAGADPSAMPSATATPPVAGAPATPPPGPAPTPAARPPLTVKDLAIEKMEQLREQAKAAETRIADWMNGSQYRAESRKVIADSARIGVGVLKGPFPKVKRVMALVQGDDGRPQLGIKDKITPSCEWVDPWNIFPDPACGENINDGDYVFERDQMSAKQVRNLKKLPGYLNTAIDRVLLEGPNKTLIGDARGKAEVGKGRFDVWYFYGSLTQDEVDAIDRAVGNDPMLPGDDDQVHVIVTLINDSVVRCVVNPLDTGSFPYRSMPWQRRAQSWAGVGVAEQMKAAQRIVNASLRALLNNAGISSGLQIIMNMLAVRPADGDWTITPNKIWHWTGEGATDVRAAITAIEMPNVTDQMMQIITLGERFAEETTSIPLIAQGQSGATTPDTLGATQLQNNNANQLLRSIGYAYDDHITEPLVRDYYQWLLLDPDVPDVEKAEWQINAHGSIALVERAIQDQFIMQAAGSLAINPAYGLDPKEWMKELLKSKRMDPGQMMYSQEELAKMAAAPPPEDPSVTVAKIVADTQLKIAVMKQGPAQQTAQNEAQIAAAAHALDVANSQTAQQKVQTDATLQAHALDMEHQRAMAQDASEQAIALQDAKTQLAKVTLQLNTERELNAQNQAHEMRKHLTPPPAVQVPGRAANGHAQDQTT